MPSTEPLLTPQANSHQISTYGAAIISPNPASRSKISSKIDNASTKLSTFEGVFLPTSLNVLSILMFLRFGFILGQMGIAGTFLLLIMSYTIDILTTLSISAISTNGTVKGGGAYYMISRSLGPEFGGAIGIIFFIGQILNLSLNVVGFIEPLLVNFGETDGEIMKLLPESYFHQVLYLTILLAICTAIALVGAGLVSKTAFYLFVVLTASTILIPILALVVRPFYPLPDSFPDLKYTGLSWSTFYENLYPKFTSGAAGSVLPNGQPETFRDLFGIFFPATAGIFAGASMSGDLKTPSKSIPKGTIQGLFVTFILYLLVIAFMGALIPRELLLVDIKVIQTVSLHSIIIIAGEFLTSLFLVIMGIVGASLMLLAVADDRIIPGISSFATCKKSGPQKKRAQVLAIAFTWFIAQIFLFADINQIATFITMAFLMTFIVMNLACFLLRMGLAPNFRPSFRYFLSKTALLGVIASVAAMYIVDGLSASVVIVFLMVLIMLIHYLTPPLKFGDISQLLIYHQVRKYLLRLKLQMSVKYWRPQILLLVDDPRTSRSLIKFCNHLKKGGLYILGHVVIMEDDTNLNKSNHQSDNPTFGSASYQELQKQNLAWVKLRDILGVKAFVQLALGPTLPWGVRNVYLGLGIGGMRPNITVIGFYDFDKHGVKLPLYDSLPTDDLRKERKVLIAQWVQIIEDLVIMQATVAVAANFNSLEIPLLAPTKHFWSRRKLIKPAHPKVYIDLYPIQMSSVNTLADGKLVVSTNFDTYTLILQLGAILRTVPEWKHSGYKLRVIVFVEEEFEVAEEKNRLLSLLSTLRIDAETKVVCLSDGLLLLYNILVKGISKNSEQFRKVSESLKDDAWWKLLCNSRSALKEFERAQKAKLVNKSKMRFSPLNLNSTSPQEKSFSFNSKRRNTLLGLHDQGLSLSLNIKSHASDYYHTNNAFEDDSESETESEWDDSEIDKVSATETFDSLNSGVSSSSKTQPQNQKQGSTTQLGQYATMGLLRKPRHEQLRGSDLASIRSSTSNLRPNFVSIKLPRAKVEEDGADSDDDNDPNLELLDDDVNSNEEEDDDDEAESEGSSIENKSERSRGGSLERKKYLDEVDPLAPISSGTLTPKRNPLASRRSNALFTNGEEIFQKLKTPQFNAKEGDTSVPSFSLNSTNTLPTIEAPGEPEDSISLKQLKEELELLSFNDIPAKGQHLILNELIMSNSPTTDTGVIFLTLPAPPFGTHRDENDAFEYTNNLAIWLQDLPPTLLVNSQTITVTTAL